MTRLQPYASIFWSYIRGVVLKVPAEEAKQLKMMMKKCRLPSQCNL
jgi:hypothetical protein